MWIPELLAQRVFFRYYKHPVKQISVTIADSYMQLSRRALIILVTYLRGLLRYETSHDY